MAYSHDTLQGYPVHSLLRVLLAAVALLSWSAAWAERYLSQDEFLQQAFDGKVWNKEKLWLAGAMKDDMRCILGHDYAGLRLSYWKSGQDTAWILDEIGKERPITIGVAVQNDRIKQVSILEFRESRGWEVRYPFFTEQFQGVTLIADHELDKNIDGVTGATLSVRAVKKVAAVALYLHRHVIQTPSLMPN